MNTEEYKEITPEEEITEVSRIFRKNLRLLRNAEGLSSKELSDRLGMTPKRIVDLEEGRMPPEFEDLILIVDFFPITFDDLLEYEIELDIRSRRDTILN